MKIMLLNPPFLPRFSRSSRSPEVSKGGNLYYPFWLSYATGFLEKEGHEVKLIDAIANNYDDTKTIKILNEFNPDLIVIDTSTPSILDDVEIACQIKSQNQNRLVVLVGIHPTTLPEETLNLFDMDLIICRGEYEYTLRDIASGKSLKDIEGISFKENNQIIHNPTRPLIQNLDELPFVSEVYKKFLNTKDYFYSSLRYPQITILTARGCLNNCSFCPVPYKGSYRTRTIKNVIEEFEYIQNNFKVREVMLEDDNFSMIKKRTINLCKAMIEQGIKLKWSCNARVDTDFETLQWMKEAGCKTLCVGFETPNQDTLNNINKNTTKEMQIEFMKNCNKLKLLVHGCFIIGLNTDTKETIRETIDFAKELNPETIQIYPMMVYPWTKSYKDAKQNGSLSTEDYSKWLNEKGFHSYLINRPELPAEYVEKMCDVGLREFYLRPKKIFELGFKALFNPSQMSRFWKAFKAYRSYEK